MFVHTKRGRLCLSGTPRKQIALIFAGTCIFQGVVHVDRSERNRHAKLGIPSGWKDGVVIDLALTARTALDAWTVAFEYDGDLVDIWNAIIVSRVGNLYVVASLAYNGRLDPGNTVSFGFQGRGGTGEIMLVSVNDEVFVDAGGATCPGPTPSWAISGATSPATAEVIWSPARRA